MDTIEKNNRKQSLLNAIPSPETDVGLLQLNFLQAVVESMGVTLAQASPALMRHAEMIRAAFDDDERPQVVAGAIIADERRRLRPVFAH